MGSRGGCGKIVNGSFCWSSIVYLFVVLLRVSYVVVVSEARFKTLGVKGLLRCWFTWDGDCFLR